MSRRFVFLGLIDLSVAGFVGASRATRPRAAAADDPPPKPVGLSLFFRDGRIAPLTLVGNAPRYLQEIDIVVTTPATTTDQGILPLTEEGEFASRDWGGVRLVEEDWRPEADGTWTLQRFYRGANWMQLPSQFVVTPVDADGEPVGDALVVHAGRDDKWQPGDDGFVRRFVVRQIVKGCRGLYDTTGANSFSVQSLAQFRDALNPEKRAAVIPAGAKALRLDWSADLDSGRSVAVSRADPADYPFGYGFQVGLEVVNLPARGHFLPGETVSLRVTLRDGQGNRLHPPGSLPTYGQYLRGEAAGGVRYIDFSLATTTYYALKHRESNVVLTLVGPADRLRTPTQPVPLAAFFAPQITVASAAADG